MMIDILELINHIHVELLRESADYPVLLTHIWFIWRALTWLIHHNYCEPVCPLLYLLQLQRYLLQCFVFNTVFIFVGITSKYIYYSEIIETDSQIGRCASPPHRPAKTSYHSAATTYNSTIKMRLSIIYSVVCVLFSLFFLIGMSRNM